MISDVATNPDRRSELLGIKLSALVRDRLGADTALTAVPFPPGAGVRAVDTVWTLIDDGGGARLGAALAVAVRQGARALSIVASDNESAGIIARRATAFRLSDSGSIDVYVADGRSLVPVAPSAFDDRVEVPAKHRDFEQLIVDGGATPVEEWGVLAGEVQGLEVCRVVDDPATGATRLEVGTGAHDREAFSMMHGDVPTLASLRRVVDVVAQRRAPDAAPHPLNRLGKERLLRQRVIDDPGTIGLTSAVPAEPPVPRPNLKDPVPAVAAGTTVDGDDAIVVCSTGVDLELVPFASDARAALDPTARLLIVTPARDQLSINTELAERLIEPAELVSLD